MKSAVFFATAFIGALLLFLGLFFASGMLYSTKTGDKPVYVIDQGEENSGEASENEPLTLADAFAQFDIDRAERLFRACAACHEIEQDIQKIGPSLSYIFDRPIASVAGYSYSGALASLEGKWTFEALDAFLANPKAYAPGTTMSYAGLRNQNDRASLIAYLAVMGGVQTASIGTDPSEETGRGAGDEIVDAMEQQLKSADIAFNRPETMRLGEATAVELVLSPQTATRGALPENDATTQEVAESLGLSADLPGQTQVVENVKYALQMEAEISGIGFDVQPPGPQRLTVLPGAAAKWVWTIEPKVGGANRVFTVNVDAIVQRNDEDLAPYRVTTFTERIEVEVSLWQNLVSSANELSAINKAIVGIGGTVIAVLGWFWARVRRKKPAPAQQPTEFIVTHKIDTAD